MGQATSKPKLAVCAFLGAAGLVAFARFALLTKSGKKAELELPSEEKKKLDGEANERLRQSAEDKLSFPSFPEYDALDMKGLLGCGGFGAVDLVEHKASGTTYALKSISKGYAVKCNMQASLRSELLILGLLDSPFVTKCYGAYNRPEYVCFLLEPCLGGDLYLAYNRKTFYGSELHARYYVGSVVLALAHMHSKSIIHRNVKPEDCVLDKEGRLKLCDMGLAKLISGKTYTTCGTPDYFAPELIATKGHSFPLDWWTAGVLLFELLAGHPPFEAAYPMKIYQNVLKGIGCVTFPAAAKRAEPLIKALLKHNPEERLPVLRGGIVNVQQHRWYTDFDWAGLEHQRLMPPYKPQVKSDAELFSARESDRPVNEPYVDDGSGWADVFSFWPSPCMSSA